MAHVRPLSVHDPPEPHPFSRDIPSAPAGNVARECRAHSPIGHPGTSSEVVIPADEHNGLEADSAAQCPQIRAVAAGRIEAVRGNVGSAVLAEIRQVLSLIMDID